MQLTLILHKKLFTDVPLFRRTDTRVVCLMLQQMRPMIALPHEVILEQGVQARGLFILTRGSVEVVKLKQPKKAPRPSIGRDVRRVCGVAPRMMLDGDADPAIADRMGCAARSGPLRVGPRRGTAHRPL